MMVLDIGYGYTKFGFTKDSAPKGIIKTPLSISKEIYNFEKPSLFSQALRDTKKLKLELEDFFTYLFVYQAGVNIKGTEIIVVESLLYPRLFTEAIGEVLTQRF